MQDIPYNIYLESVQWRHKAREVLMFDKFKCQCCKHPAQAVHHVLYPKAWRDDGLQNLISVCYHCHRACHGIRENDATIKQVKNNMSLAIFM